MSDLEKLRSAEISCPLCGRPGLVDRYITFADATSERNLISYDIEHAAEPGKPILCHINIEHPEESRAEMLQRVPFLDPANELRPWDEWS